MATITRYLPTATRILLGLIFFVFGLNGFLQFLPQPPLPDRAGGFIGALVATGYLLPMIKATEVIAGLFLLTNRLVPLALLLLAPIVVNIFAFHTILTPPNPVAFVVLLGEIYLAWSYRDIFRHVLVVHAKPTVSSASPLPTTTRASAVV